MNEQLTVRDVSERLGVSERWVRQFISDGELRATKVRQWRIDERDLEAFLDARVNRVAHEMRNQINAFASAEPASEQALTILDLPISDARAFAQRVTNVGERHAGVRITFRTAQNRATARVVCSGSPDVVLSAISDLRRPAPLS